MTHVAMHWVVEVWKHDRTFATKPAWHNGQGHLSSVHEHSRHESQGQEHREVLLLRVVIVEEPPEMDHHKWNHIHEKL